MGNGKISVVEYERRLNMQKQEFESLAMRHDTAIGNMMFAEIEQFYMADNQYHEFNGGIEETKQAFVQRVFNGKVNTPKTIARKLAAEAIRENRYALRGNKAAENRLAEMDKLIENHINGILEYNL